MHVYAHSFCLPPLACPSRGAPPNYRAQMLLDGNVRHARMPPRLTDPRQHHGDNRDNPLALKHPQIRLTSKHPLPQRPSLTPGALDRGSAAVQLRQNGKGKYQRTVHNMPSWTHLSYTVCSRRLHGWTPRRMFQDSIALEQIICRRH